MERSNGRELLLVLKTHSFESQVDLSLDRGLRARCDILHSVCSGVTLAWLNGLLPNVYFSKMWIALSTCKGLEFCSYLITFNLLKEETSRETGHLAGVFFYWIFVEDCLLGHHYTISNTSFSC